MINKDRMTSREALDELIKHFLGNDKVIETNDVEERLRRNKNIVEEIKKKYPKK